MNNKYNTLLQYILDNSINEYHKETVNGLFRSILEPIAENNKLDACVLLRIFDLEEKESLLKRLSFSGSYIYSYNDLSEKINSVNIEKTKIWGDTEFIVVIGPRYSAALLWDYSLSERKNYTPVCLLYNSKYITDIAKKILDNSSKDIKDILLKYLPDRRENSLLNKSVHLIADKLNSKNEEIIFSELEKINILKNDDRLETASIVAEKAKFIAHEIKNNLSVINLYSKISQKRLESVKAPEEILNSMNSAINNIVTASESISSHINDLRCLSSVYKTDISIKELIYSTAMQCAEKARKSGVEIDINDFSDVILNTDKVKLQCAVMNIIYNAIEACSDECRITIDCIEQDKEVKILIKNNGVKIPDEIKTKIFESEFTTKEKGNGLGLAICRKQLQLAGGNINLVNSDEKETVFEIIIPVM